MKLAKILLQWHKCDGHRTEEPTAMKRGALRSLKLAPGEGEGVGFWVGVGLVIEEVDKKKGYNKAEIYVQQ